MKYLIDHGTQLDIAARIDLAVEQVLSELPNHGGEEGLTSALGHALMQQSFQSDDLRVSFKYRQLSKYTEEPAIGADGGFLVRVTNADTSVQKAVLFQAKLIRGFARVRQLTMSTAEVKRLQNQARNMLTQTDQAVAVFYTPNQVYVVDAADYQSRQTPDALRPLSQEHRLITLGTYLGRWVPRCTKGDQNSALIKRVEHVDGFKQGLEMDIISKRPSISSNDDKAEALWKQARPRRSP